MKQQYAIIDIGSNTMRLVIYEKKSGGFYRELENTKVVARLRTYLEDGVLNSGGIDMLLTTLKHFQESTRFYELQHVVCVATATIRQAANQNEIKDLIEEHTDFRLRILSEFEEAYYGYLSVMNSTSFDEGITIDIGGGSTELTYFKNRKIQHYYSFPFGALSLKQQCVKGDIPTAAEREELKSYVYRCFESLPWLVRKNVPIIAIGGSARNMAKVYQNMIMYPISGLHLFEMSPDHIDSVKRHLTSLNFSELQKLDGLAKDRADTIIPAVEVFQSLVHVTQSESLVISRKGLREGIFYEEITKPLGLPYYPNVTEESLHMLSHEYEMDVNHVLQLIKNIMTICIELEKSKAAFFSEEELLSLRRAAKVFNIGRYIDEESISQHTFYLLANKTIEGMMHKERIRLALLASYKSRVLLKQYIEPFESWFSKDEQRSIRIMGAILQFASALNVTNRNLVEDIEIVDKGEHLLFSISCRLYALAERVQAEKQKKLLEKVLKRNIELHFYTRN